jgi:hypothetical protein
MMLMIMEVLAAQDSVNARQDWGTVERHGCCPGADDERAQCDQDLQQLVPSAGAPEQHHVVASKELAC